MLSQQWDTCINDLNNQIAEDSMEECNNFINLRREARHLKTIEGQKLKFDRFCHKNNICRGGHKNFHHGNHGDHTFKTIAISNGCSNIHQEDNTCTPIDISSKPLTKAQEKLLAHGPNYAVVPKNPPIAEYISVIEQAFIK